MGYAISASSCVAAAASVAFAAPAAFRYATAAVAPFAPAAPLPVPALVPRYPVAAGYGCFGGCYGGQICLNNVCGCPTGLVLTAGYCAPVAVPVLQVQ